MPTGSRRVRAPARGFSYLLLLFALAIGAAGLAALGQQWQQAAQRQREAELLFRGGEIARALGRYRAATPDGLPPSPERLEDLLEDRRGLVTRHHLRRLYADPFTGEADWVLITSPEDQRIVGVHSRSRARALRTHGVPIGPGADRRRIAVGDWHFMAATAAWTQQAPASAAQNQTDEQP